MCVFFFIFYFLLFVHLSRSLEIIVKLIESFKSRTDSVSVLYTRLYLPFYFRCYVFRSVGFACAFLFNHIYPRFHSKIDAEKHKENCWTRQGQFLLNIQAYCGKHVSLENPQLHLLKNKTEMFLQLQKTKCFTQPQNKRVKIKPFLELNIENTCVPQTRMRISVGIYKNKIGRHMLYFQNQVKRVSHRMAIVWPFFFLF